MCTNCNIYHFCLPVEWCCEAQASSGTWESLSLTTSMTKWSLTFLSESGETAMTGTRLANGRRYYLKMRFSSILFLCVSFFYLKLGTRLSNLEHASCDLWHEIISLFATLLKGNCVCANHARACNKDWKTWLISEWDTLLYWHKCNNNNNFIYRAPF